MNPINLIKLNLLHPYTSVHSECDFRKDHIRTLDFQRTKKNTYHTVAGSIVQTEEGAPPGTAEGIQTFMLLLTGILFSPFNSG